MRKYLVIIIVIASGLTLKAQDPLFSLVDETPGLLNTSLNAFQNASLKFQVGYKEQGSSFTNKLPLRTLYANVNHKLELFEKDKLSFGLSILGDKGGAGHYTRTFVNLNGGYAKKLTDRYSNFGAQYLAIGAEVGVGQFATGWDRFWFGNQFNTEGGYIDENLSSGETEIDNAIKGRSKMMADINTGLSWYGAFSNKFDAFAGISAFHLNRPDISFLMNSKDPLQLRWNIHGGVNIKDLNNIFFQGKAVFIKQGNSNLFILGGSVGVEDEDYFEIRPEFGAYLRMANHLNGFGAESLIAKAGFDYNQYSIYLAYDFTISKMSNFNSGRGGWELHLHYNTINTEPSKSWKKKTVFRW